MLNGHGELPPWPMRVACNNALAALAGGSDERLKELRADQNSVDVHESDPQQLLDGLAAAVGVWYNYSGMTWTPVAQHAVLVDAQIT